MKLSVTIDVPDLSAGLAFYGDVFGFTERARPVPVYAVLEKDGVTLGLMQKPVGSRPFPDAATGRDYARHWTPVHVDFHVEEFDATMHRLRAAGGTVEQEWNAPGRPATAFCADPFGNGFCLMGPR